MPEDWIISGDLEVTGDADEAARLINLFEGFPPETGYLYDREEK